MVGASTSDGRPGGAGIDNAGGSFSLLLALGGAAGKGASGAVGSSGGAQDWGGKVRCSLLWSGRTKNLRIHSNTYHMWLGYLSRACGLIITLTVVLVILAATVAILTSNSL